MQTHPNDMKDKNLIQVRLQKVWDTYAESLFSTNLEIYSAPAYPYVALLIETRFCPASVNWRIRAIGFMLITRTKAAGIYP